MSTERDEYVFQLVSKKLEANEVIGLDLTEELLSIARKWRSKATMRQTRIDELTE